MAEDSPFLQVDNDWKKQAQEEKRRLAEKAAQQKAQAEAAAAKPAAPAEEPISGTSEGASFGSLVQQMLTQTMFYLGEISYRGAPPMLDLDRARHQHDLLTMLEEKTQNNLDEEERKLLDTVLHEIRTRFIRTASEYISF